ncbi:MAG: nitrile hydratase subunit beta [Rhodobacteraceae bacterium CG17_big_fil_post_rev_8_21_14_2_50_65_11]|nr:MAG: nitrile hydratase subunit beta [Rhodobacteraceae bacterium CG17_big_fil_post_rev_8_21_14_2_50_65_11]
MDGIHDLGGKQGFGPVLVTEGDAPFAQDWERRMWALSRDGICPTMTIDWFRHGVELMVPGDYLTFSYFQKWATNFLMLMVDAGQITLKDLERGYVLEPAGPAKARTVQDILEQVRRACTDFSVPEDAPARFATGAGVRTLRHIDHPHTRLPAYARDACGTVIAHHGAHLLPDEGAQGRHLGQHLYTVAFAARELWGEAANPRDDVTLDLWESYLVPS